MLEDDKRAPELSSLPARGRDMDNRPDDPPIVIDAAELFADRREVEIRHAGQTYRLRITRNGKLILNK